MAADGAGFYLPAGLPLRDLGRLATEEGVGDSQLGRTLPVLDFIKVRHNVALHKRLLQRSIGNRCAISLRQLLIFEVCVVNSRVFCRRPTQMRMALGDHPPLKRHGCES
jgi:hypothetical protein